MESGWPTNVLCEGHGVDFGLNQVATAFTNIGQEN